MGKEAKFVVRLSVNERLFLNGLVAETRTAKERSLRSRLFLKADADGPCWTDWQIADAFDISVLKVARLRKRCVLEGLDAALCQRPQANRKPRKLDGAGEARLVVWVCGKPPSGRSQWTLQLLADKLVELKIVDEISDETVRKTLKKRTPALASRAMGHSTRRQCRVCLPDGRGAECVSAAVRSETTAGLF